MSHAWPALGKALVVDATPAHRCPGDARGLALEKSGTSGPLG